VAGAEAPVGRRHQTLVDELLGLLEGVEDRRALGEQRRGGRGEGAAGAVVVGGGHPGQAQLGDLTGHDLDHHVDGFVVVPEAVGGAVDLAALHHHPPGAVAAQLEGGGGGVGDAADRLIQQGLGLADVGGGDQGVREQGVEVRPLGAGVEQAGTGRRHQHRVDHQVGQPAPGGGVGHVLDDLLGGQHAGLHRSDGQVRQHGVELGVEELGRRDVHRLDADRVLGGQRRDDAGAVDAEGGERDQIGLDAGTPTGVRARDRQRHRRCRHARTVSPTSARSRRTTAPGSAALMTAPMTATPAAPASTQALALRGVTPPRA
jgi:hypothetical protein